MNVQLKLIVLHIDLLTGTNGCLLDEDRIITYPFFMYDVDKNLRYILRQYIPINLDWVNFHLLDVTTNNICIFIHYGCLIPCVVEATKGNWINLGDIHDKEVQRLAFQASQRLTIG
jgi:hypothetical protein